LWRGREKADSSADKPGLGMTSLEVFVHRCISNQKFRGFVKISPLIANS
jgi:hypothetical protein